MFIHTLDTIPNNWCLELEMRRIKTKWDKLIQRFKVTFTFEHESLTIVQLYRSLETRFSHKRGK
jgi:hypothetical protein